MAHTANATALSASWLSYALGPLLVAGALVGGCEASVNSDGNNTPGPSCSQGTLTCASGQVCDKNLGCVQCSPGTTLCMGSEVHQCSATGTVGALMQTCPFGQSCLAGACVDNCEIAASDYIYVVDEQNNFMSFAPRNDNGPGSLATDLFKQIGVMACRTARPALSGFSSISPFSMAVDRHANAWVLYDTGEMFNVSPQDASCVSANYQPLQLGWEVFGMGYVSDAPGAKTDTLYVGRATEGGNTDNSLGKIDSTLTLSSIARFTAVSNSPEMTGTANAELYGYFPSNQTGSHLIALIDRTNASFQKTYQLTPLPSQNQNYAYAFAQWGGRFYYFITMTLNTGSQVSRVYRYDPSTNMSTLVLDNSPYVIVGAGVSTCAPTTVG
jgi:hypothetical protein